MVIYPYSDQKQQSILENYHGCNYFIFSCDNRKVNCDTPFTIQSNPPVSRACMHLIGQQAALDFDSSCLNCVGKV